MAPSIACDYLFSVAYSIDHEDLKIVDSHIREPLKIIALI